MARKPKYRRHSTDLGFVEHAGKRSYFPGAYRALESLKAYRDFLIAHGFDDHPVTGEPRRSLLLFEVARHFLDWAEKTYPNGPRSENANLRAMVKHVCNGNLELPVAAFTPGKLKDLQRALAKSKLSRGYINSVTTRVKRMFRWAVSEELVPAAQSAALDTVTGLRKGRSGARETRARQPVAWEHVEAILSELSPHVRAMVLTQWYTGVRPQSVCYAKVEQFDRSRDPWEWTPRHKGEHLDRDLVVFVGPKAQAVLAPFLAKRSGYLFAPLAQSGKRGRGFKAFYDPPPYQRAVARAIERTNRKRDKAGLPPIPRWTPHQLRHSRGTLVREAHGLEAAQAVLGHARMATAEIYAKRLRDKARAVAIEMG